MRQNSKSGHNDKYYFSEASLVELAAMLAAGEISSYELTSSFLQLIEELNPQLNALISTDADKSLAAATAADERIAKGEAGPLIGIPIIHKDIFCTQGWRTTCGSRMLADFISPYDATVVHKLEQEAGMVPLGKANMDEFAMGSTNETSFFGAVKNPWELTHAAGGSSGGSAAAVAARLAPAATGTDTGGSIRQPAALCGVSGIKPTYGAVSRWGMVAYASSLDQGGVLAKSAADCAILLAAMSGTDPKDSTCAERSAPDYQDALRQDVPKGLKIGVPTEWMNEGLDNSTKEVLEVALKQLAKLGVEIVDIHLASTPLVVPAYYVIAMSEASSNLARYDGVRYGHRAQQYDNLEQMYCLSRAEGFGTEVRRRIMIGTFALSAGYYDAYYIQAQKIRRIITDDFRRAFSQVDAIVGPVTPSTAPALGSTTGDPVQMYLSDIYTLPANLAGLPGMSIPVGFANGLPVGLQLLGDAWQEGRLLNLAHHFQQTNDWHRKRPTVATTVG